jgi:hypothetical protein
MPMLTIEDFRNGFHPNLTEERARQALSSLADNPIGPSEHLELAGIVSAIVEAFPDVPLFADEPAKSWLVETEELEASGPNETAEWNGYYAARFAVSGAEADLAELVRRAKHRDGSAASVGTSSAALSLLLEAGADDPEIAARIKAAGLDLNNVRFGNHPAPSLPETIPDAEPAGVTASENQALESMRAAAPAPPPPVRRFNLQTAVVSHAALGAAAPPAPSPALRHLEPAAPVTAVPAPPAPSPAAIGREVSFDAGASPNLDAGDVSLVGVRLSITAAARLALSLTAATRALLLPAEGCAWVDDRTDPAKKSELVVLDPVLAEGLPPSAWDGALLAELGQSVENGTYQVKVYDRNGGSTFVTGSWIDMNNAKAAAAERVRPELRRMLGQ